MKKATVIVLTVLMIFGMCFTSSAAKKLTEGVTILNPRKNIHGVGYEWDNPNDTLTLTDLYIDTTDDYGLKLPDKATVILKGTNRIKASKAALYIGGDVIIKGSGSLILESDGYGIMCNSSDGKDKLSIIGGTVEITAKTGIYSAVQKVSLSDAKITVTASEYAADVRDLVLSDGVRFSADSTLMASSSMSIEAANLKIDACGKPALICENGITMTKMDIMVGNVTKNLASAEKYDGEFALETSSTWKYIRSSIIFGEGVPMVWDIVLFVVLALCAAAAVVLPIYFKKRKLKKILASK